MRKVVKLSVLLGVLIILCVTAFTVSRHEEKKEQIKNSGETILEIPSDNVTALSWENEEGSFSFTKDDTWTYDDDPSFPVDEEKINNLLSQFETFSAAFVIEEVDDYAQYGLDDPICTIHITTGDETYTVKLGDFSKMDEQRYISLDDGNAYLVSHDPLDEFGAVLKDMILDDTVPEFDLVSQLSFSGTENYTITRNEDGTSICQDDIYFTDGNPLDTDLVDNYIQTLTSLSLSDYVSYNVTEDELETFGLDSPELTLTLDYATTNEDGETESEGTFILNLSRNPEEFAA